MNALEVNNLCVTFNNHHIIENISFTIEEGQVVAIIGPNGAGKTTLLKAVLGLVPVTTGSVTLFGLLKGAHEKRIRVGYVPQRLDFDRTFPLTVSELVGFSVPPMLTLPFVRKKSEVEYIGSLLDTVGARELENRKIGSLSGGELQRIMIARAIANSPRMLFLDEPASGVDIEGQERFYDLVERLSRVEGITVVLISHDLNVVYRFADNVLCINRRLICSGRPRETLTDDVIKTVYGEMMGAYIHSCHEHD